MGGKTSLPDGAADGPHDTPPPSGQVPTFLHGARLFLDWRMAKVLLLGCIQGYPWVLIGTLVTLWLKEEGLSRSGIGLFGLVFAAYAANLFWAPVVDRVRIPFLSRALGQRKAWVLLMQAIIMLACLGVSTLDAGSQLFAFAALCLVISTASATQDVALDALRIELFDLDEPQKVAPASAMMTSGWWVGYGIGGAAALFAVDAIRSHGGAVAHWNAAYLLAIPVMAVMCALLVVFTREGGGPSAPAPAPPRGMPLLARGIGLYWDPIKSFIVRFGVAVSLLLVAFIVLFKVGEAFLGRMSLVFYKEVGFGEADIAKYSKLTGTVSVCVFAVLGSLVSARYGLFRGIVIGGVAMALTNLLYAALAVVGPDIRLFVFANVTDQFTTAVSTVAFVAFISQLCDRQHTATHYAALASLGNLSRTTLSAGSGFLVDALGGNWALFFVITTLMVIPGLSLLFATRRRLGPFLATAQTRVL